MLALCEEVSCFKLLHIYHHIHRLVPIEPSSFAVVVDSLTTNDGVMINSGKSSKLIVIQSSPLDVGREMSIDIDVQVATL